MINFATSQGVSIPEGRVTKIEDAAGNVLWKLSSGKVVLEVEKIVADTYAGETEYTGEEFILLDIYPKANGTVTVTYGGLTKTITDTSGADEPNAQQVFFGTLYGVSDSVETPASGTLTIEGDYKAFAIGVYQNEKLNIMPPPCRCITAIIDFGTVEYIPDYAFSDGIINGCTKITKAKIPSSVTSIGSGAFAGCTGLMSITIPSSVTSIGKLAFNCCYGLTSIIVDSGNEYYSSVGGTLFNKDKTLLICYPAVSGHYSIPSSVKSIGGSAFWLCDSLASVTIPSNVTSIGELAFDGCTGLVSVTFGNVSGWYVTETEGATSGTDVNVTDTAANATMMTDTYKDYYWYRTA